MSVFARCPCRFKGGVQSFITGLRARKFGVQTKCPVKESIWGQPAPHTHPHLVQPDELVPGLTAEEFIDRRKKLAHNVHQTKPKSTNVIVVPSATTQYMSDKIPYVFRQNSDFRYLTGCLEPDSVLVMVVTPGEELTSFIFVREKNTHSEMWEGPRTGVTAARDVFHVDQSKPFEELFVVLKDLWKARDDCTLWYDQFTPAHSNVHKTVMSFLNAAGSKESESIKEKVHELRVIKSVSEQRLMARSAQIASNAIEEAMEVTKAGLSEHHIFATVDYHCRMNGAEYLAYPPVVATGNNATIIHYINNNQQLADGDLILVDAGCELHGYCSDITRTWPVNSTFNEHQRTLYDVLYTVQSDLLAACGQPNSLQDLFKLMCELLGARLKEAHILSKYSDHFKLEEVAFKLCPHHVGHFLGMDVHDTSSVSRKIPCAEGMVITMEPGVYINESNQFTKPEFWRTGIRIEDDVLFTSEGPKVLSTCAKTADDIERIRGA